MGLINIGINIALRYSDLSELKFEDISYENTIKLFEEKTNKKKEVKLNKFCIEEIKKLKKYYHDLIITAIFNSCSLFNNKFAWHIPTHKVEEMINYYLLVEKNEINSRTNSINDINFINEIHDLLLTDELFNHQLELYTEKNEDAEEVIKELKLLRKKRK